MNLIGLNTENKTERPPHTVSVIKKSNGFRDVIDVLNENYQFSRFCTALETAGADIELDRIGAFTLFAPTNGAFEHSDILAQACCSQKSALQFVNTYVAGARRSTSAFLGRRTWVRNLNGQRLLIDGKRNFTLQGAAITQGDWNVRNGVVHELADLIDDTAYPFVSPLGRPVRQALSLQAA
ncbi:MAG: fasciclin domain-containing protein [Pseudomonadota bacterium]